MSPLWRAFCTAFVKHDGANRNLLHASSKTCAMWRLKDATCREYRRQTTVQLHDVLMGHLWRERAQDTRPDPAYLTRRQKGSFGAQGRTMLVRWVFAEATALSLSAATAVTAVSYLDRVLSEVAVPLGNVQEVAATCLHLARKILETGGDAMDVVVSPDSLLNPPLEMLTLQLLKWKLIAPTAHTFLSIFFELYWIPTEARALALVILKCALPCTGEGATLRADAVAAASTPNNF